MFHRKHRHRHGGEDAAPPGDGCISLSMSADSSRTVVVSNPDIKTLEMGLHPGAIVHILHNHPGERNIIVKVNDNRYVLPRVTADKIIVRG